jgi:uncharacterized phage protein (TIGR02220 family)
VEASLQMLMSPDTHSRSLTKDGARIIRTDGGYEIINYQHYRTYSYSNNPEAVKRRNLRQKGTKNGQCPDISASASASASIASVIEYLNLKLNTHYRIDTGGMISARMREGFSVENMKTVIDKKAAQWSVDVKMAKYLRPITLFSKKKFEQYLNEKSFGPDQHNDALRAQAGAFLSTNKPTLFLA